MTSQKEKNRVPITTYFSLDDVPIINGYDIPPRDEFYRLPGEGQATLVHFVCSHCKHRAVVDKIKDLIRTADQHAHLQPKATAQTEEAPSLFNLNHRLMPR